jgi:hypothetical protein
MDRIGGGSSRWEQYTRIVHELMFTVPDDALSSIGTGDELQVTLQGREGAVSVKLSHQQVRRLLEGDPRNRARKTQEAEQY